MSTRLPISAVIPTYRRGAVLLETIDYLLAMDPAPAELLIVDQTENHEPEIRERLSELDEQQLIRWIRLDAPSIPHAMNRGLLDSRERVVMFLDDDIRPEPALIAAHHAAHQGDGELLVAGRVIQPWEEGRDFSEDEHFHFAGLRSAWIDEFMGGNFSLRRATALELGGFDENFVRVAYRFEAEFAYRFRTIGGRKIYFEPAACLHHLKAASGGTRTFGEHLSTWRPDHAVGAYYFALRTRKGGRWLADFVKRPFRAVATRHHLYHPWWIPVTCLAEFRGMAWAMLLAMRGPRLVQMEASNA